MDIQDYGTVLKRRWLPASVVLVTVLGATGLMVALQPKIFAAEGKIRFTRDNRTTVLNSAGGSTNQFAALVETENPMITEIEIMRSAPIVDDTIATLYLRNSKGEPLTRNDFLKKLSIVAPRGADIARVSYRHPDPDLAVQVVDTLMQNYLSQHLQAHRAQAVAARQFLAQELPLAEARVKQSDELLRRFQERYQVTSLAEEKQATVTAVEALRSRIAETQATLANRDAQGQEFGYQLGMGAQEAIAVAALSQSPGIQEVLKQLQAVESELALKQATYREASPVVQSLNRSRDNLGELLGQRITAALTDPSIAVPDNLQLGALKEALVGDFAHTEVVRQGLANELIALRQAEAAYGARMQRFPRLEQQQRELTRDLEVAQTTYATLLQRLHETEVAENQNVGNAWVVQPAYLADEPVSPKPLMALAVGGLAGLGLAAAAALVLEARDQSLQTVAAVRDGFGFTVLGLIPTYTAGKLGAGADMPVPDPTMVVVKVSPTTPISEAFRMLQSNLKYLACDRPLRTLLVTSSVPNEGKSVVSANLAMAMAELGQRVLLIDADMRRPTQHHLWDILNDVGLSQVIVEAVSPEQAIKSVAPNLMVLTAGSLPPNPAVLLASQKMHHLLESLTQQYDFVVIDTPALNIAADVPILSQECDGILYVTRPGVVDFPNALIAKERIEQAGLPILGQVINGVIDAREPYSYYYFTRESGQNASTAGVLPSGVRP